MRKLVVSVLLAVLALGCLPAHADQTLVVIEGRLAAARIDTETMIGIASIQMGERTDGMTPSPSAERSVCAVVVDTKKFLFDQGCARADVFVDDLFLNGNGAGTIASEVFSMKTGQKVGDSTLAFDGVWTRDPASACAPAYKTYYSSPVFIAADTAVSPQCEAHATFSISSATLGAPVGTTSAVMGLIVSESFRGQ